MMQCPNGNVKIEVERRAFIPARPIKESGSIKEAVSISYLLIINHKWETFILI